MKNNSDGGKYMKRYIIIFTLLLNLCPAMPYTVSAQAENNVVYVTEIEKNAENANDNSRVTDKIEVKYRVYKGVVQYRRWNATKNRWVDSEWRNL